MTRALGLVLAGVVLGSGAGGGPPQRPPRSPVAAVRAYIAALDRHDPAAICGMFAPALRADEARTDSRAGHPGSCRGAVRRQLTSSGARRWSSAAIARVGSVTVGRRGIAAVRLTLDHHYVCVPAPRRPGASCRAATIRRAALIDLTRVAGAWRVLTPGLVAQAGVSPSA